MVVTRYAVVGLVAIVLVSIVFPFAGVVAAQADDETETDSNHSGLQSNPVESTLDDTDDAVAAATNTTDDAAGNATEATRDTLEPVPTGPAERTDGLTGDVDDATATRSEDAEGDRTPRDPVATVERLSREIDTVTVTYRPGERDTVRVVVESDALDDDTQPAPAAVDELAQILEIASTDPGVEISLVDREPLTSSVHLVDGTEDGLSDTDSREVTPTENTSDPETETDDRSTAAFALPELDHPVLYVPPLAGGLFVLLNPMSGLLSGILAFLGEWAGRLAALFRYSSRDGSDPLEHETRTRIDDHVSDAPGIPLSDLADRLETPLSTVRYHVKILERERYLTSRKHQGHRRLYPMEAETGNAELAAAMDNESTATIVESIARQGQATVGDIVDDVGTTYSTVSHHLSRLADAGVVTKEKDGRCTVSRLAPAARTALHREREPSNTPPATQPSSAD